MVAALEGALAALRAKKLCAELQIAGRHHGHPGTLSQPSTAGSLRPARPGCHARHDRRVTESLETQFLHADQEVECPACEYPIWVIWAEIVAQAVILCPCCRVQIRLADAEGSVQKAARAVEQQISQFLKGFQL